MMESSSKKTAFVFVLLFSLFFVPAHFLNDKMINNDDTSYIAHAYTLGVDMDMDYTNEIARKFNRDGNIPSHFIGSGALAAPFVGAFSLVDRINSHPVIYDRHQYFGSWSYFGFLFAVNFYFLLGLLMLYYVVKKLFDMNFWLYLLAVFGSGVVYYVLGRYSMSHGFEFFGLSAIIFSTYLLHRSGGDGRKMLFLSFLVGFFTVLVMWIRPSSYQVFMVPFFLMLFYDLLSNKKTEIKTYFLLIFCIAIWMLPFFAFNYHYFHGIFPSSMEVYSQDTMKDRGLPDGVLGKIWYIITLTPNLILVFFSSEVGLLYTTPILVFGFSGFVFYAFRYFRDDKVKASISTILIVLIFALPTAIVLIWKSTASDYGYRYLFNLIPLTILGFAFLWAKYSNLKLFRYATVIFLSTGVLSLFFYKTSLVLQPYHTINVYGFDHEASLKDYNKNVFIELTKPKTYLLAGGKTYFGFLVAPVALKTDLVELVPDRIKDKYLGRFENIPLAIYLQTFSLLILWCIFGYVFQRYRDKDETNNTDTMF